MPPWDPGLQPERTELSWRRTVLAATTGLVLAARYLGEGHPVLGVALPALAVVAGLLLLRLGTTRLRRIDRALRAQASGEVPAPALPGAGLLAAVAAAALLAMSAGAAYVLAS